MKSAEMKYIVFNGYRGEQIIIFPKIIQHSVMADDVKKSSFGGMYPISGGFIVNGECVGRSESLMMDSRGYTDTVLIDKLLDLDIKAVKEVKEPIIGNVYKNTVNKNRNKRMRKKHGGKFRQ